MKPWAWRTSRAESTFHEMCAKPCGGFRNFREGKVEFSSICDRMVRNATHVCEARMNEYTLHEDRHELNRAVQKLEFGLAWNKVCRFTVKVRSLCFGLARPDEDTYPEEFLACTVLVDGCMKGWVGRR